MSPGLSYEQWRLTGWYLDNHPKGPYGWWHKCPLTAKKTYVPHRSGTTMFDNVARRLYLEYLSNWAALGMEIKRKSKSPPRAVTVEQLREEAQHLFGKSPERGVSGEKKMETKLYKWTIAGADADGRRVETEVYGKRIAVDGSKLVMKRSGDGALDILEAGAVSEVLPYTVGVTFSATGKVYHYYSNEGELAVGDVIMVMGHTEEKYMLAFVHSVDTKSRAATLSLTGYVLPGAKALSAVVAQE